MDEWLHPTVLYGMFLFSYALDTWFWQQSPHIMSSFRKSLLHSSYLIVSFRQLL